MFSILGDLRDARVLDVYAGSGALSIEALSRGALSAVLVEHAKKALDTIRKNLAQLGLEGRARIVARDCFKAWGELERLGPFDVLLVDPPYRVAQDALGWAAEAVSRGIATREATIMLEHSSRDAMRLDERLTLVKERNYGDSTLKFFRPSRGTPESEP